MAGDEWSAGRTGESRRGQRRGNRAHRYQAANNPPALASAPALRLDAGDLLEITTFDTPELSGKFRVDSRGDISLPLGGAVPVQGLTAEQAAVAVERFLRDRDILKNPHVTVLVLEYATQGVNVMGEVKQPGIYPMTGKAWRTRLHFDGGGTDAVRVEVSQHHARRSAMGHGHGEPCGRARQSRWRTTSRCSRETASSCCGREWCT